MQMRILRLVPFLLLALLLTAETTTLFAQKNTPVWNPSETAISPDGKQILWIDDKSAGGTLEVAAIEDVKHPLAFAMGKENCEEKHAVWSPDSRQIAFFASCNGEPAQLYLATLAGTKTSVRQITKMSGAAEAPAFSPDGSYIAFLFVPNATRPAGATAAIKPWSGVVGRDGVEIQHIATVSTTETEPVAPTLVTPDTLHIYEFDRSPDGNGFAYVAAAPPGENNWWVARLYTQTIGAEPKVIFAPNEDKGELHGLQIAVPRWSPDGAEIAFIGGLMSDQGSTGGDIFLLPAIGGKPINLTPERKSTPKWIEWGNRGQLWFTELNGGSFELRRLQFEGVPFQACPKDRLLLGCGVFVAIPGPSVYSFEGYVHDGRMDGSISASADHRLFAFIASSMNQPPEIDLAIAAMKPELRALTHRNNGVEADWGKTESLNWTNEGLRVQGWLTYPREYDPAKKYPLVMLVHGGPAASALSHWGGRGALSAPGLSEYGYFVLAPNPRGSYGQGESFVKANRKDFGYGDLRDILKGLDAAEAKASIDPNHIGIMGWSYGGFMTMFAVTQTQRFHAAVAGAGIANWQSYYGENSIDQWLIPYFGASVYDDPAVYAKSSAINYIHAAKTPTLVVVGDRDGECPAPQSFEFWHALRDQGTPVELVVYPNEGHGFRSEEHLEDLGRRIVDWFAKYLPAN
jgi:dipeptidyl aminopeptidase/acylaminoacyl peptidase